MSKHSHPSLRPEVFGTGPLPSTCAGERPGQDRCGAPARRASASLCQARRPSSLEKVKSDKKARVGGGGDRPPLLTPPPFRLRLFFFPSAISQNALPTYLKSGAAFFFFYYCCFIQPRVPFIFRGDFISIGLKSEPNKITRIMFFLLQRVGSVTSPMQTPPREHQVANKKETGNPQPLQQGCPGGLGPGGESGGPEVGGPWTRLCQQTHKSYRPSSALSWV